MADRLKTPLPEPAAKPHRAMEFALKDDPLLGREITFHPDPEDDFDFQIPEDDDFDI